ncbi:MAG: gamma-glutamylcyclotransferase [Rhodobacteraceae bacterium]|nr:MAG: gamma-glutamylcyclotransferase [Paracoccaceae bacterium]
MTSLAYFAYGSNMLPERLRARCPSAAVAGAAAAPGFRVAFAKDSRDGSGKATLLNADNAQPGVLFRLAADELPALDAAEGADYDRVEIALSCGTRALTYIAKRPDLSLLPYDWYLALCVAGAARQALGEALLGRLRAEPWRTDPLPVRPSRLIALRALSQAGFADWRGLLTVPAAL